MDNDYQVQTDYLRQQLAALRDIPRSRWKKYRLLEVVCRECGDTVLEVIDLDPYRVVRTWDYVVTKGDRPHSWHGKEWSLSEIKQAAYENENATATLTRRGEPMFHPIPVGWDGDADELILTACECRGHTLTGKRVSEALATRRKLVI